MNAFALAETQQPMADQVMVQSHTTMLLMNPVAMEQIYRFSEMMASGKTAVPAHLRGNVADCMAITMQAMQWKLNPFAVMQKTHVINGVLGYWLITSCRSANNIMPITNFLPALITSLFYSA